jgi:hypothetical protein
MHKPIPSAPKEWVSRKTRLFATLLEEDIAVGYASALAVRTFEATVIPKKPGSRCEPCARARAQPA